MPRKTLPPLILVFSCNREAFIERVLILRRKLKKAQK